MGLPPMLKTIRIGKRSLGPVCVNIPKSALYRSMDEYGQLFDEDAPT
jgi:hypothetical protein